MKKWVVLFFCIILLASPVTGLADDVAVSEYLLGPGDMLSINVFGIAELAVPEIAVRLDGKITMPLIGEITANQLTTAELSKKIADKLHFYYQNPFVTVSVMQFRTTRVYVVGQVNRPGSYELDRNHTLMDAIGAAQGWNKDAAKTKVFVIHQGQTKEPQHVNLLNLLDKGNSTLNCVLNEGDIVYLTENHKIDIVNDVLSLVAPLYLIHHWGGTTTTTTS